MPLTTPPILAIPGDVRALEQFYRLTAVTPDSNSVGPTELQTDAVTTSKIDDEAVTADKLADDAVTTDKIIDGAVDNSKLRDSTALSVIGRASDTVGDPADIVASSDGDILRRNGSTIGFGSTLPGAYTVTGSYFRVENTTPRSVWYETDAAADEKLYDVVSIAGVLSFRTRNDADGAGSTWMAVDRNGASVTSISFGANNSTFTFSGTGLTTFGGNVTFNGNMIANGGTAQLSGAGPIWRIINTIESTDRQRWQWRYNSGSYTLSTITDSNGAGVDAIAFVRGTTTSISGINLGNATSNPPIALLGTGAFTMGGGVRAPLTSKSADYTATLADQYITVDASGASRTITLPALSTCAGLVLTIKKIDSSVNAVVIDGNSAETIDGAATKSLASQYDRMTIIAGVSEWHIV